MSTDNHRGHEYGEEPYNKWLVVGNVKRFITTEKKYKEAYRKILMPLKKEFRNDAETLAEKRESDTLLERILLQRIECKEDFAVYFELSKSLLSKIEKIIPRSDNLQYALKVLKATKPSHFFMSCLCYHSAIMIFCEFVHLHRIPDKFKIGLQLAHKADIHLGIGVVHYMKIIRNLIRWSKINWANKGINEISKIIGKRATPLYKKSPILTVDDVEEAIKALEISIPFAKYAYGNDCCACKFNDTVFSNCTIINNSRVLYHLSPISESQFCIRDFEIKDGIFDLPLGFRGFVSECLGNITVCFRGSIRFWNYITDALQHVIGTSVVYKMALGLLLVLKEKYADRRFWVLGHSLGGGLTQFAVIGMNCSNFVGFGYNSAGLSKTNKRALRGRFSENVFHLYLEKDKVFLYGFQLGYYVKQNAKVSNYLEAHGLCTMCKNRNFIVMDDNEYIVDISL